MKRFFSQQWYYRVLHNAFGGGGTLSRMTGCQEITRHAGPDPASINANETDRSRVEHGMTIGFTLSEVLITLGITGVVAAITMPVLINNINNIVYKKRLKHTYSLMSQAFLKKTGLILKMRWLAVIHINLLPVRV